ncbi:hypothetical protein A0H81_10074 [Grifola frondosa]|uniref:Uncharacterized protein n=1 Tax=Grifola frondosa TaxID=5627 RepID=A0A1C7LYE2_GRIFR|nr:hypothetical protein A0H81_10074 [Grifola frondosa]
MSDVIGQDKNHYQSSAFSPDWSGLAEASNTSCCRDRWPKLNHKVEQLASHSTAFKKNWDFS